MTDGKVATFKYRVSGKVLQFAGANEGGTLMIEELTAPKMILHTGVEGQRVVCERQ